MGFSSTRSLLAGPALGSALLLSSACAQAPAAGPQRGAVALPSIAQPSMEEPSKLDYLVFASLADSPNLLAVSSLSNRREFAGEADAQR